MSYQVKIPVFEGPLDLLLHLIEKNEVDIYDIPIAVITEQYLQYIYLADEIDLDLTSEFLLMACTLLSIKAKMLLPQKPAVFEEDEAGIDPRQELVEKLLEYKLYKEKAGELRRIESEQARVFWREIDEVKLLKEFPPANPLGAVSLEDLLVAYNQVLRKMEKKREVVSIMREAITVQEKMEKIMRRLGKAPNGLSFSQLFVQPQNREEVIITFLALLETMRRGLVIVRQADLFAEIMIFAKDQKGGLDLADSVS